MPVRRYRWAIPIVVSAMLLTYFMLWPWYRDRDDIAEVRALTADLAAAADEIEREAAVEPTAPTAADVARVRELNARSRELVRRMEDAAPKLKGETGEQFRAAQDRYLRAMKHLRERLDAMLKRAGAS